MESNELRIGNYFKPTDGSNKEFEKVTIDDLYAWNNGAIYGKLISLTKEWLLKFGFIIKRNENAFYHDELEYLEFWRSENWYFLLKQGSGHLLSNKIEYVHQLQNLYFALTNNELTIK